MREARACVDSCGAPSGIFGVVAHLLDSDLRPFEYMCNASYNGKNIVVKKNIFF
jgi:hypothetical protein